MTASTATAKPVAKSAPAAKDAPKTETPAFDFSKITVGDGEMPKVSRPRDAKPNPLLDHVKASYETDKAKVVTVPESQANDVKNMIRRAATALKIGASIAIGEPDEKGNVTINFKGKPAKKRAAKSTETETATPNA